MGQSISPPPYNTQVQAGPMTQWGRWFQQVHSLVCGPFSNGAPQTTITGSAGALVCSQPDAGSSYKKVICTATGYTNNGTQTYIFPTPFTSAPAATHTGAGLTATISKTGVSIASTATTGYLILEGI